jgi:hypothetical protein
LVNNNRVRRRVEEAAGWAAPAVVGSGDAGWEARAAAALAAEGLGSVAAAGRGLEAVAGSGSAAVVGWGWEEEKGWG